MYKTAINFHILNKPALGAVASATALSIFQALKQSRIQPASTQAKEPASSTETRHARLEEEFKAALLRPSF
jgi:hypothetical protein